MNSLLLASSFIEPKPGLIFWTIVTFILVAWVLKAKAWKPILDLLAEREKQIQSAIDTAKHEKAEAEKLLTEQKAAIAQARREAAEMVRKSQADVEKMREQLLAESRKRADEELANAQRRIQEEKAKAVAEIRSTAVDLAIGITEKLLGEKLDDSRHRHLAEQFVDQLPRPSAGGTNRLS